jgi:hypothetical protein
MAKIKVTKKDPPVSASVSGKILAPKTAANDQADTRDILSMIAGGGHTSLSDPEVQKAYQRLSQITGAPAAQKLVNSVFLYGQRPEVKNYTPEQRVAGFYDLGSNDSEVATYLRQGKGIGYGVLNGFRASPLIGNMALTGRRQSESAPAATDNGEKIKVLVKSKINNR